MSKKFDVEKMDWVTPKELRALAPIATGIWHKFDYKGRTDIGFTHDFVVLIRNNHRVEIKYKDLEKMNDDELKEFIEVFYKRADNCFLEIVK